MSLTVSITWRSVADEYPDAESTVLVSLDGGSEPVWFGFTDGKRWMDACTGETFEGRVTHWAELPMGMHPAPIAGRIGREPELVPLPNGRAINLNGPWRLP